MHSLFGSVLSALRLLRTPPAAPPDDAASTPAADTATPDDAATAQPATDTAVMRQLAALTDANTKIHAQSAAVLERLVDQLRWHQDLVRELALKRPRTPSPVALVPYGGQEWAADVDGWEDHREPAAKRHATAAMGPPHSRMPALRSSV